MKKSVNRSKLKRLLSLGIVILALCLLPSIVMTRAEAATVTKSPTDSETNTVWQVKNHEDAYDSNSSTYADWNNYFDSADYKSFGTFSIPSTATITAIHVSFIGYEDGRDRFQVSIAPNGNNFGTELNVSLSNSPTSKTVGGSTSDWGVNWNVNQINSNLQVRIQTESGGGGDHAYLTDLTVTVTYTAPITGVSATDYNGTYDGNAHTISVTGTQGGDTVTYGTAPGVYNLATPPTFTNAGSYPVYYKVIRPYYDDFTGMATVNIAQRNITSMSISAIPAQTYSGSAVTPAATIAGLTAGTDFTVSYSNNVNAGTATATANGIGNYTGSTSTTFTINPQDISSRTITAIPNQTYTGSAITPAITITGLTAGTDFSVGYSNNTAIGTATATATGTGNYTGSTSTTFAIIPIDISTYSINAIPNQIYSGSTITPAVTIPGLTAGTDFTVSYSNNVNAGTATATATGVGNYAGSTSTTFTIDPQDISSLTIGAIPNQTYTGSAITPTVTITGLTAGTDFNASYSNNVNTGTATATATGTGNYTGSTSTTFVIDPQDISSLTITAIPDQTYTGSAITPIVTIPGLTQGTDFTVSYTNNTAIGTATATATGIGNYTNTTSTTFSIVPIDISTYSIDAIAAQTYTGSAITPTVTIPGLTQGTDFSVSYTNNVNAGTATATATGIGNYTNTTSTTFTINPKDISTYTIDAIAAQTYTGSAITPAVTIPGLTQGTDFTVSYTNNTAIGTATATATGIGNYTNTTSTTFSIVPIDISTYSIDAIAAQTYTGSAITPTVTIPGLTQGTDFTVSYTSNTAIGTATATATGIGNYTNTTSTTFSIVPIDISTYSIDAIAAQTYTGSAITPIVTIPGLTQGTDFTVSYTNNVNAGTATATATGIGNYTNTTSTTFTINPKDISTYTIDAIAAQTYTGSAITPAVTIPGLTQGTDFTVSYTNNVNAGTATATATGIGNYTNTTSITFTINPKAASVTPAAAGKYVGNPDPALTGTLTGFIASDNVTATYSRTAGETVGTYTISATLSPAGVLNNYTITYNTAAFTITGPYVPPSNPGGGGGGGETATIAGDLELILTFDGNRATGTADLPGAAFDYNTFMQETVIPTLQSLSEDYDVTLNLNVPDSTDSPFRFTMDGSQLADFAENTDAALRFSSPIGSVRFDAAAVDSLADQAGGDDVTVTISKLTAAQLAAYPGYESRTVFDISVSAGGTKITSFGGGEATVTLPYTPTQAELDAGIVIYYMSSSGPVMVTDCMYDAETGTVSFVTNHLSVFAVGYVSAALKDDEWYTEYFNYLEARGIMDLSGFSPDTNITRAQFVTILAAIDGADLSGYRTATFDDVKSSDAYFGAVEWAADNGIIEGYEGLFSPAASITRQDICTILMRYADYVGFLLPQAFDSVLFNDDTDIASYAAAAVSAMQQAGILDGFPGGSFQPTSNTTQAQAAKIFTVFMQLMIEY